MDIQPVKCHTPPALPMQHEFDSSILNEVITSVRWQRAARVVGTCAALQWMVSGSVYAEEPATKVERVDDDAKEAMPSKTASAQKGEALVIPLLEDALANDGRGAFGCVAVNPPAFLSEGEALDLIRKEFAKAGLTFDDKPIAVANIARPETETWETPKLDEDGKPIRDAEGRWITEPLSYHPTKTFSFDLSCNKSKIRVEYIGRKDYGAWQKPSGGMWCSVSAYNFSDTATRLRDSLVAQSDLENGVYGIFFDPLAHIDSRPAYPNAEGMTKEERQRAWDAYSEKVKKLGIAAGRERLQQQIDHFLGKLKAKQIID